MASVKRFIAGAVCPRCSAMDRLLTYTDDQGRYRECVACGFFEKMPEAEQPGAEPPQTRVTRPLEKDPNRQPAVFFRSGGDSE